MTIQPVGALQIDPITSRSSSAAAPPSTDADGDASSARISPFGQFFSKLQSLEKSDPAKAKQVLSDIATKLKSEAQQVGGDRGQRLSALADKFQKAADTGDLSGLQPAQPSGGAHHHGGGHHHKAQAAYAQQAAADPTQSLLSTLDEALSTATSAA